MKYVRCSCGRDLSADAQQCDDCGAELATDGDGTTRALPTTRRAYLRALDTRRASAYALIDLAAGDWPTVRRHVGTLRHYGEHGGDAAILCRAAQELERLAYEAGLSVGQGTARVQQHRRLSPGRPHDITTCDSVRPCVGQRVRILDGVHRGETGRAVTVGDDVIRVDLGRHIVGYAPTVLAPVQHDATAGPDELEADRWARAGVTSWPAAAAYGVASVVVLALIALT